MRCVQFWRGGEDQLGVKDQNECPSILVVAAAQE